MIGKEITYVAVVLAATYNQEKTITGDELHAIDTLEKVALDLDSCVAARHP